jgi:hypothetical protein
MTNVDRLPELLLKRKAVIYVRQSTQTQVQTNLESLRRQYDLVEEAKRRGFRDIEVIDEDTGRSASGAVARPGFERLVAYCVLAKSERSFVWTPHVLHVTGATGTICLNSVGLLRPG